MISRSTQPLHSAPPSRCCSSSPSHLFGAFHPPSSRRPYPPLRFIVPESTATVGARLPSAPLRANPLRSTSPMKEKMPDTEEEEDYDDDDDVSAVEYDEELLTDLEQEDEEEEKEVEIVPVEAEAEPSTKFEERVAGILADVREFGAEIIDYEELAGIYDFPIDKFQRLAIQAFLRDSSIVVSAPTSSGKTLIAEVAAVATVARGSYIYEPSSNVIDVLHLLEEQQKSHSNSREAWCEDGQFSGMVEAWASGLTWREIMMDCAMDVGDLARLLRRTIDLLSQIPKLPDIDPSLQKNALLASNVMDRPPISELAS